MSTDSAHFLPQSCSETDLGGLLRKNKWKFTVIIFLVLKSRQHISHAHHIVPVGSWGLSEHWGYTTRILVNYLNKMFISRKILGNAVLFFITFLFLLLNWHTSWTKKISLKLLSFVVLNLMCSLFWRLGVLTNHALPHFAK